MCCVVLCCVVLCCVVLCCVVLCCAVLCCAVLCCAVRCGAVRCGAVRCGAVRCGAVRCGAVRCGAVRCGVAVRCCGAVLRCGVAVRCCGAVLRCGVAVRCCGAVLRCGVAVRCCGAVLRCGAVRCCFILQGTRSTLLASKSALRTSKLSLDGPPKPHINLTRASYVQDHQEKDEEIRHRVSLALATRGVRTRTKRSPCSKRLYSIGNDTVPLVLAARTSAQFIQFTPDAKRYLHLENLQPVLLAEIRLQWPSPGSPLPARTCCAKRPPCPRQPSACSVTSFMRVLPAAEPPRACPVPASLLHERVHSVWRGVTRQDPPCTSQSSSPC